jgi:GH24 family phage-related lysozyme (muramidase)
MKLSRQGAELIARFEGFVNKPYNDAAGNATIGFGHLLHGGPVNSIDHDRWQTISRARGLELLLRDAESAARAVNTFVKVKLNQHEFDALVSFVFNVGAGAFHDSRIVRLLNAGHKKEIPAELLRWSKAGGRTLPGLLRRRQAEGAMFRMGEHIAGLSHLTDTERRWCQEYDKLLRARRDPARRRALRAAMTRQRKRIWQEAQKSGWNVAHRRERYHSLLARTK